MPSSNSTGDSNSLSDFIEEVAGTEAIRIEEDFGHGFVRLRSSEAERRQAAQDIRSSEDVVIELLRNSRDAGAENIYIATGREGDTRTILVLDDGKGIPESMRELIFQPRITSKLDSAHMDKWGLHGRGMALFSIAENSKEHYVVYSSEGDGSSIKVTLSSGEIGEKKDQSTFPYFEILDDVLMMRGPKNIQRVTCEFAIDNRADLNVYLGSITEIAATLYWQGVKEVPAKKRIFSKIDHNGSPAEMLSYANDPYTFCEIASKLGLNISTRSARRILDHEIEPLDSIFSQVESTMTFSGVEENEDDDNRKVAPFELPKGYFNPHITKPDMRSFKASISDTFKDLSEKYFLDGDLEPKISIRRGKMIIEFDLVERNLNAD